MEAGTPDLIKLEDLRVGKALTGRKHILSLTVEDKLRIAEKLDELGIDYIEGGYPGSNERDADFFKQVEKLKLRSAKIAAFGTTAKFGIKPSQDSNLKALLSAETSLQ